MKKKAPLSIAPVRDADDPIELLAPYRAWSPRRLPDPRTAPLAEIADGLTRIVETEGPVLDHRAFRLYTAASGLSRAMSAVQARYRKALKRALDARRLEGEPDGPDATPLVLRAAGKPALLLRERGDRTLEEIPLAELAALMRKLELDRGESSASDEERCRRVLAVHELIRLTAKSKDRLLSACARAALPRWTNAITNSFEPEGPPPKLARPRRTFRRLRHG